MDKPTSARDYDDIRWYLMHVGVIVFVEEGDWYVQYQTQCKNLGADNLCGVYDTRPEICREYEPGACDYSGGSYEYDHLFTHPKQVEAFYFQKTGKKLGKPAERKPGPPGRGRKKRRRKTA